MTYDSMADFSALWGLIYFMVLFAAVVAYALWPRNQDKFDRAARMPLSEDDPND